MVHQGTCQDMYERLRERLDGLATGYPATPGGVEMRILKELFSPRDAELFLLLDMQPVSPASLAARINADPSRLAAELEDMAKRGLIFRERYEGQASYRIAPFVVGLYEYQIGRLNAGFAQSSGEYYLTGLGESFFKTSTPHVRTIPINTRVIADHRAASYEDASAIINSKERIAVAECICRKAARINGLGCQHSLEVCLQFDAHAQYYVDNNMGRYISAPEALQILQQCEKEGLVLQALNSQKVEVMCACCSCCCGMLLGLRHFPGPGGAVLSNHVCVLDEADCIGCGACVKRCPTRALKMGQHKVALNAARCIGCGLCVDACIVSALSLERKPEDKIYTPPETIEDAYALMAQERLK